MGNAFDSKTIFVSLSLLNLLRFPIAMMPMFIGQMLQVGRKNISLSLTKKEKKKKNLELEKPFLVTNKKKKSLSCIVKTLICDNVDAARFSQNMQFLQVL